MKPLLERTSGFFVEETSWCEVFIKTIRRIRVFNAFSIQCYDVAQADAGDQPVTLGVSVAQFSIPCGQEKILVKGSKEDGDSGSRTGN